MGSITQGRKMNKFDKKIVQLLKADNSKTGVQVKDGNRVDIINEENKFIVEVRKIDNNKDAALHAIVDAADALVPPIVLDGQEEASERHLDRL